MEITRKGKYAKFNIDGENYLAFVPSTNDFDSSYKVYETILNKTGRKKTGCWSYQCCEEKEEYNNFENLVYSLHNIYGQIINSVLVKFDFSNEKITIGERVFKVKKDNEYTYKFQKTQIKAVGGIQGLYKFFVEEANINTPFLGLIDILEKNSKK